MIYVAYLGLTCALLAILIGLVLVARRKPFGAVLIFWNLVNIAVILKGWPA